MTGWHPSTERFSLLLSYAVKDRDIEVAHHNFTQWVFSRKGFTPCAVLDPATGCFYIADGEKQECKWATEHDVLVLLNIR